MYLLLEAQQNPGNLPNKCVLPNLQWNQKFITLNKAGEEAEWLRQFLKNIPSWPKSVPAICIHCNNQVAIFRVLNFIYNCKSKHIRRRHNTVKQLLSNEIISIEFV